MSFTDERIQETIKSAFRGKPLFKFNSYDMKKLNNILKNDYSVKSYKVNYIMEIITIIPTDDFIDNKEVMVRFIRFRGWGKNIRND